MRRCPGCCGTARASIHDAISAIPIPVFQGNTLPGNFSRGDADGDGLYQDYQNNRPAYADYEFLHKALNADGDSYADGVRTRRDGTYRSDLNSADEVNAITDQDELVRTAAIENWYAGHQSTAHSAREDLLNQYSHTHAKVPGHIQWTTMDHGAGGNDPSASQPFPPGSQTYGSGASGGGGGPSVGALPSASYDSGGSSASWPGSRPPHEMLGAPQVGHPGPSPDPGSGLASSSGLTSPDLPAGLPSSGVGSYGPGGVGGGGIGGGGGWGGGSGTGVPATTTATQRGWWNSRPGSAPMGPRVSAPGTLENTAAMPGRPGSGPAGGMGMMPHGGAGKGGDREEYQTWLTEDDDDIWAPRREDITTGWIE